MTARNSAGQNAAAINQNLPGNSRTGLVSQGEGTQTGIFAGAEKFMASDVDAPKEAKEDLANQGAGLLINGKLEFVDAKTGTSSEPNPSVSHDQIVESPVGRKQSKMAYSTADLPPLPNLSEYLDDSDFLAWLLDNNQLGLEENCSKIVEPAVRKKYCRYLEELRELQASQHCLSNGLQPSVLSGSQSTLSSASSGEDLEGTDRGPFQSIAHALHLDRGHRKKEKIIRKQEEAQLQEEIDMANWEAKLKKHHQTKMSHNAKKAEELKQHLEDNDAKEERDSWQVDPDPTALPMSLLNPEFIEKKQKENEVLDSGGDPGVFPMKKEDEDLIPVSSERITQLIEDDRRRKESTKDTSTLSSKQETLDAGQF